MEPAVLDLRAELDQVGDQGQRGTCVAFAFTSLDRRAHGDPAAAEALSEEFLYWAAKQRDGTGADGTTFFAASTGLHDYGQSLAQHWPYDDHRSHLDPNYSPPQESLVDALAHRGLGTAVPMTVDEIRRQLVAGTPVAIAIPIWDEFENANMDAVTPTPTDLIARRLEHAVVVVGHDSTAAAVLIRNSWGTDWGTNGYGWIADTLVSRSRASDGWIITRITESP